MAVVNPGQHQKPVIAHTLVSLDPWQVATFITLFAAVIALWIGPRYWWSCLGAAIALGYVAGILHGAAIASIALASIVCELYARNASSEFDVRRVMAAATVVAIALLLGMHLLPGFNNPIVIDRVTLTPDAAPYTLYLNFDKTLAGLLLLGVCYPRWPNRAGLRSSVTGPTFVYIVATVLVLIGASYLLGYVRFEPKWTSLFWVWAAANLLSTCLSEEAFFRGFVQRELQSALRSVRHGQCFALLAAAVLFGLAHFAGGWRYVLLATLAGVGYGYLYQRSQRIEWAMLAHFALNATHFLLFTYPQLSVLP
jgi:membrane protease YdiL (CAAX protease family)